MERQFIIVNKNNEELSFNSTDIFGHTPEGLGLEMEATTYQAYNSFNDMVLTVKQNEIGLKLTLGNDSHKPYASYMRLLKFLNVGGLILRYVVPDVGTFERKIALRTLSKKDMDLYSVLQEEIKFVAMSPWYSWVTLSKDFDRVFNSGRIWDDSRIYQTKYAYSWSNTGLPGTIYSAYSWSSDGKSRFTTVFPNLSILTNTRDYANNPNISETYYKRTIISSGGVNNAPYIQQTNTSPISTYKDTRWDLPLNTIKTNTRYTLSFYARGSGKIATFLYPTFLDTTANSGFADTTIITPVNDGKYEWSLTSEWVKHTYTFNSKASLTANQNFLFRLENGNSADICLPKLEEGAIATEWMPNKDEVNDGDYPLYIGRARIDNDKPQPTDYKTYVWQQTNIQSGKEPVVYRGDFTREFPRLNLLTDSKDFKNKDLSGNNQKTSIVAPSSKVLKDKNDSYLNFISTADGQDWFRAYLVANSSITPPPEFINANILPNTKYTFSFLAKGTGDHKIYAWNNWTTPSNTATTFTLTNEWKYYSFTVTSAATIPTKDVEFFVRSISTGSEINLKYPKVEEASTATPWMPSSSEVTIEDYPLFLGKYEGLGNPNLDDPLMYNWSQYGYQSAVDANMLPDPTFATNPPLLSNSESKKKGDTWQVFNTGTNVGTTVTKTSDGLKLVNMGNNKLYLRPNQMITLNGNNVYRLEYDMTVSSVGNANDLYIGFSNQSQMPDFNDVISTDIPYVKIPVSGAVATNKDVVFNPISIHNMVANTKTHRIIDITVPFGYEFVIIQAVNSNQSTTVYNNFKLSYPIDTINHPADGPYSIISPITNVYQIDYSRASSYLEIDNDSMYFGSQQDSSLRITIKATPTTGTIKNPSWYLADADGNKLQTEGFLTGIPVGYELVVSSDPFERLMVLRDSSGKLPDTEIDTFIDPMVTGWIRVPLGESRLILSDSLYSATGGFNAGSVSLEYKKEWVIV